MPHLRTQSLLPISILCTSLSLVACQASRSSSSWSSPSPSSSSPPASQRPSSSSLSSGIIGGQEVSDSDPSRLSTVAVYDSKNGSTCSGSLIAKDMILTAAHCMNPGSNELSVLFSKNLYLSGHLNTAALITAKRFERHPSYNPDRTEGTDTFDLALIQLSSPAPSSYQTAKLSQDASTASQGNLIAAGFGFSNGLFRTGLGVLRQAPLKFIKMHSQTEIETLQDDTGVCSGDSGGPLYQKIGPQWLQIGVASRVATKFLGCRDYAVYTRVDRYQNWIQETTEKLRKEP